MAEKIGGPRETFTSYSTPACPCGKAAMHVMYAGLPGRLCTDTECSTVTGAAGWAASVFGFNGWFVRYEGSYWAALWRFLRGD